MILMELVVEVEGQSYTLAKNAPVMFGGNSRFPITITHPHVLGGNIRNDVMMMADSKVTLTFTLEPDPDDSDTCVR